MRPPGNPAGRTRPVPAGARNPKARAPSPLAGPAGAPVDPARLAQAASHCAEAERLLRADRLQEARKLVGEALRLAPGQAGAINILGVVEMASGNLEEAAKLIRRATELEPGAPEPLYFLGLAYGRLGRHEDAAIAFRAALALRPGLMPALRALSLALQTCGRMDEARAVFRQRLEIQPADFDALHQLARNDPAALTPADRERLTAAAGPVTAGGPATAGGPDFANPIDATACLALAELFEAEGDADRAFLYLKRGNDRLHEALARDAGRLSSGPALGAAPARRLAPQLALQDLAQRISHAQLVFTGELFRQYAGHGHPSSLPVFVLGMPRSGSSLIEQILASHPLVHGAGEIDAVEKSLVEMRWPYEGYLRQGIEGTPFLAPPPRPAGRYFRELGAGYVKALRGHSARAERIVDKMPINFLHIGMIHLCLPRAVILHAVRDPVDTCLGCYKRPFASGYETTYDLALLGRHYLLYRQLMAHWQRLLPGRVIDVVYERLVADPEAEIRRLLAACGLPWNDACLRFHENRRPVSTASLGQVRQPIFTHAVQRWRRYEKHLGPLLEVLGPSAFLPADQKPADQKEERGS